MKRNCFQILLLAMFAGAEFAFGQVERITASPADGFHYDYLLLAHADLRTNPSLLVVTPTPHTSEDTAEFSAAAERIARNVTPFLGEISVPVLVPVLPRPPVRINEQSHINLYVPALSRAALLAKDPQLARMDLQVLAMMDHARKKLKEERQLEISSRAIFAGFSAGGHFATRMAVLHPERVLAVWAGGTGGHPILPLSSYRGKELTYPIGVRDLEAVTGRAFDQTAFSNINFMIIQGGNDSNTSLPSEPKPSDSYSFEQAERMREILGSNPIQRLEKARTLYESAGAHVRTRIYPEAGHQMTPAIIADMLQFISATIPLVTRDQPQSRSCNLRICQRRLSGASAMSL